VVVLDASGLGPLQLNGTFAVEVIAFLAMIGILARWVYPPVMAAAEERQNRIKHQLEQAEQTRVEAQEQLREAEGEVRRAREQAGQIVERANRAGEHIQQEAQEKAHEEARRIVEAAGRDIDAEREQATQAIRQQLAGIVTAAAAKIVGESLDQDRHRKLIEAAIDEVEKEPSAPK